MRRLLWFAELAFLLHGASAYADRIDDYVKQVMQKEHIPGVSIAVLRSGKTVLERGYGLANVEMRVAATPATVYEILSVSKQFTAAAILLLVREGKIALEGKVRDYLPASPEAWKGVTVRHLLTHTSGIPDYTDAPGFRQEMGNDRTPEEILKPVRALPLLFEPGSRWRYSNSGYYVLGLIIEKVSGKPLDVFLRERIFQPLGMSATRIESLTDVVPDRASGYHWLNADADRMPPEPSGYHGRKNVLQNAVHISPTVKWAAGGLISTVGDLAKWDAALLNAMLLTPGELKQMVTPVRLTDGQVAPYGFGNELSEGKGRHVAGHQGGGMAFNAAMLRYLEDKTTVIVLANLTQAPTQTMARHLAAFYIPGLSDEDNRGIPDTEPKITEMVKQVLLDAAQGKASPERFAPSVRDEMAPFVKRQGPRMLGPLGELKSFTLLERKQEGPKRIYRYRSVFGETSLIWTCELDADGRILSLEPVKE